VDKGVLDPRDVAPHPAVRSSDLVGTARQLEFSHENPAVLMAPSARRRPARAGAMRTSARVSTLIVLD
jgi:hypothetical protein